MAIITISRGTFSGGEDLARRIADHLDYRCISREVLVEAANDYGADERRLYNALVEKPGFIEHLTSERENYLALVQAALCKLVKDDNVVYHGHAGHLLLNGVSHVLKVRVIANMEMRVKAAMYRKGLNQIQAVEYVAKMDKARAKWTRFLYHVDWEDPLLYDLVVNLDHLNLNTACEAICAITTLDKYQTTRESQIAMNNVALSADVNARIIADNNVTSPGIEVNATDGLVIVSGMVGSPEEVSRIGEIAHNTPGAKWVRSNVTVDDHWALVQGRYLR